jgi:hypothetical protein
MSAMTVVAAIDLMLALLSRAAEVSQVIAAARAEGRDTLTPDEWAAILKADDAARDALLAAIMRATPNDAPPTP